jgi:hypothetical protein
VLTTTDINGGTVDGVAIGAGTPGTGAFTTLSANSTTTLSSLTASTALALDASKNIVSVTNTGTGNNVLATSPVLTTPNLGTPSTLTLTNATGLPTAGMLDNAVTDAKLRDSAALSVIGRATNTSGDPADIAAGTDHQVLRRSGTAVGFGAVALDQAAAISGTLPVANGGTGITSFGGGVATFLSTPSSANLAAAVTDETGSGALVFGTNPTISGATISTGSINNTPIGASTANTGSFTNLTASGTVSIPDDSISGDKVEGGTINAITINTLTSTTVNTTTVDATNIEVTNIKAKDGTAAGSIADATGVVTLNSSVLTTTDINGGSIDGAVIGGASAAAATVTTLTATQDSSFTSTGALLIPVGTEAQRPTAATGKLRFNTTVAKFEGYNGTSWTSVGGGATGGGSDSIFIENGQTVTTNYSIPSAKNAMSTGPITVNAGITVTVPPGSRWVVL